MIQKTLFSGQQLPTINQQLFDGAKNTNINDIILWSKKTQNDPKIDADCQSA